MEIDNFFPIQDQHVRNLLGLYLRRKREEMGLTLTEVATQANLTTATYRRIEGGRMKIEPSAFNKIQSLLELDPVDLGDIRKIAAINYVNHASKTLAMNYPL